MRFGLTTLRHPATRLDAPRPAESERQIARKDAGLLQLIHEASGRGDVIETLRLAANLRDNHAALGPVDPFFRPRTHVDSKAA